MINFFITRPIFASTIAVIMVLAGSVCYFLLPVSQFPDISPPQVVVSAVYPGASAQVVRVHPGAEVGAVYMPAPQTGSPMSYMINGRQYIVVAVSGVNGGELIAYALPSS